MTELRYGRTPAQRAADFQGARQFELTVSSWLGPYKVENLNATDRMDFWVPGVYLDVKEKNQPLSSLWPLPAGAAPEDCFILDELSIRRALEKFPHAYFLLHDVPGDRIFLARVDEVLMTDRRRVDRVGPGGKKKGKWVVRLTDFRQLTDPDVELYPTILADQIALPWKRSECLFPEVEQ